MLYQVEFNTWSIGSLEQKIHTYVKANQETENQAAKESGLIKNTNRTKQQEHSFLVDIGPLEKSQINMIPVEKAVLKALN
jgi:hypothetical protein